MESHDNSTHGIPDEVQLLNEKKMSDFEIEVVIRTTDTQGPRLFFLPNYKGMRISKSALNFDAATFNSKVAAQNFLNRKYLAKQKLPQITGTWAY